MKAIVCSDEQFNPWKEFSRILPSGRNSRLQDQLNAQDETFKNCISLNAHLLIHNGDLFESLTEKIDKVTFLTVYDKFVEFSKSGIIIILIVGNHDWLDRTEKEHILEPFKEIENIIVVDTPRVEEVGDTSFCFIPYTKMGFTEKVEEVSRISRNSKLRYLFTHQGVRGAKVGPRDTILKDEYSLIDFKTGNFDLVFNGHYHKPQTMGSNFIIVGSSVQKDFGERGDRKGFWILDTETRSASFTENSSPKFHKVELRKGEKFNLPEKFSKDKDFLWLITEEALVTEEPIIKELLDDWRIRIDLEISRLRQKPRTEISINMGIEDQLASYVKYAKTELDKNKLVGMGVDKWRKSQ